MLGVYPSNCSANECPFVTRKLVTALRRLVVSTAFNLFEQNEPIVANGEKVLAFWNISCLCTIMWHLSVMSCMRKEVLLPTGDADMLLHRQMSLVRIGQGAG